jgi:hypothetical protein
MTTRSEVPLEGAVRRSLGGVYGAMDDAMQASLDAYYAYKSQRDASGHDTMVTEQEQNEAARKAAEAELDNLLAIVDAVDHETGSELKAAIAAARSSLVKGQPAALALVTVREIAGRAPMMSELRNIEDFGEMDAEAIKQYLREQMAELNILRAEGRKIFDEDLGKYATEEDKKCLAEIDKELKKLDEQLKNGEIIEDVYNAKKLALSEEEAAIDSHTLQTAQENNVDVSAAQENLNARTEINNLLRAGIEAKNKANSTNIAVSDDRALTKTDFLVTFNAKQVDTLNAKDTSKIENAVEANAGTLVARTSAYGFPADIELNIETDIVLDADIVLNEGDNLTPGDAGSKPKEDELYLF